MSRPVHFEIQVDDPMRAMDFYQIVLGWSFEEYRPNDYWLIKTGEPGTPGINGAMLRRRGPAPDPKVAVPITGWVCTMQVRDLETILHAVSNAGGTVLKQRFSIPGVGWAAYARDSEGNVFGLTQADPAAA